MYYYGYNQGLIWPLLAIIIAVIVGLCFFYFFVNNNNREYKKNIKKIKDYFDFKEMVIESFLKIFYIISFIYITLISFYFINYNFYIFLGIIILGNILIRLIYEGLLMIVMIWKNTNKISENTKK